MLEMPPLEMDVAVQLDRLSVEDVEGLDYLAPCGNGNPAPLFLLQDALIEGVYPVGDGRHCRVRLHQGASTLYGVYFGTSVAQLPYQVGDRVDVALSLSVYEGKAGTQLSARIKEIRPTGQPDHVVKQATLFQAFCQGAKLNDKQ